MRNWAGNTSNVTMMASEPKIDTMHDEHTTMAELLILVMVPLAVPAQATPQKPLRVPDKPCHIAAPVRRVRGCAARLRSSVAHSLAQLPRLLRVYD